LVPGRHEPRINVVEVLARQIYLRWFLAVDSSGDAHWKPPLCAFRMPRTPMSKAALGITPNIGSSRQGATTRGVRD
jgi:hypothetical protein